MKISQKLILILTGITATILLGINTYIYLFSYSYSQKLFYTRLRDRAELTAKVYLEEDEISSNLVEKLKKEYIRSLPNEVIRIYDPHNVPVFIRDSSNFNFSAAMVNEVRRSLYAEFKDKQADRQTVGIYYTDNQGDFVIMVSATDPFGRERMNHLEQILIIGFFASIIVVFITGRLFVRQVLLPISNLTKRVRRITATNLHLRVREGNGKDEIAQLAITFNNMLSRLEDAFEMQKSFIHNASHELRTPLTSIIGEVEVTLSKVRDIDEYKKVLCIILVEAERLNNLTNGLLRLAQVDFDDKMVLSEEIRIDELLWEVHHDITAQTDKAHVQLNFTNLPENADDLVIRGNRSLLHAALYNVIDNAYKFSNNAKVNINLAITPEHLQVSVQDFGIGMLESDTKNIFQTFYRADNARAHAGSGVGLSLTEKILQLHKSTISIDSKMGVGTTVSILFPRTRN